TREVAGNPVKLTRVYASAATNHHLEITETAAGRSRAVWGVVSFDPGRQSLVLRQFGADGSSVDAALQGQAAPPGPVVFASEGSDAHRTRITCERTGANSFVERIEQTNADGVFALVSETRFVRKE